MLNNKEMKPERFNSFVFFSRLDFKENEKENIF